MGKKLLCFHEETLDFSATLYIHPNWWVLDSFRGGASPRMWMRAHVSLIRDCFLWFSSIGPACRSSRPSLAFTAPLCCVGVATHRDTTRSFRVAETKMHRRQVHELPGNSPTSSKIYFSADRENLAFPSRQNTTISIWTVIYTVIIVFTHRN